jgi:hypothetical protein
MEAGKDDTKVAKGDDEAVESFWSNTSYKVSQSSTARPSDYSYSLSHPGAG